jgi:hypothetical protein
LNEHMSVTDLEQKGLTNLYKSCSSLLLMNPYYFSLLLSSIFFDPYIEWIRQRWGKRSDSISSKEVAQAEEKEVEKEVATDGRSTKDSGTTPARKNIFI